METYEKLESGNVRRIFYEEELTRARIIKEIESLNLQVAHLEAKIRTLEQLLI